MHFKAPWGRMLQVISGAVTALMFCIVGWGIAAGEWSMPPLSRAAMMAVPLLILALSVPFLIRGYTLQGDELLVHRLGWDSRCSLNGLQDARSEPLAMSYSIRVFGNGGVFSFTGLYWSRKLGRYRAWVTDLKRTVVLKLADRTVVISPEDPEQFVKALTAKLDHATARL